MHARSTTKTGTFFWQLKTVNLIYAGNSHGYMNALEFMKDHRTGKRITGTNIYSRNHFDIRDRRSLKRVQEFWIIKSVNVSFRTNIGEN